MKSITQVGLMHWASALLLGVVMVNGAAAADKIDSAAKVKAPSSLPASKLPEWNGVWVIADFFMDKQDSQASVATPPRASTIAKRMKDAGPPVLPKFKGAYAEQAKAVRVAMMKGTPMPDPSAGCLPQGLALFWNGPYAFEIMQTPGQINIFQEWNEQTHRIYLDGRKHPEDPDPTYNGHSIGHWDGKTLMIDSLGFTTESYMDMGVKHGEAMHIAETIRQLDTDLIEVTQTITDPDALEQPWTRSYKLRRKPAMEVVEYVCAQNNRNAPGADGTTGLILQGGNK